MYEPYRSYIPPTGGFHAWYHHWHGRGPRKVGPRLERSRFDGDRYFIADDQFDLYGEGPTLEAAQRDYWLSAQDYLADLEADADRLAPYLADRLVRLRALLASDTPDEKDELI
jgi:hypothetical protein